MFEGLAIHTYCGNGNLREESIFPIWSREPPPGCTLRFHSMQLGGGGGGSVELLQVQEDEITAEMGNRLMDLRYHTGFISLYICNESITIWTSYLNNLYHHLNKEAHLQ